MKVCMNCHLTYDDAAQVCAQCGNPLVAVAPQQVDLFDHTADFDAADISDNKVFAMLPYLMSWIGENMATKGYVVIAVDHTDSTYTDFNPAIDYVGSIINRTVDQRFVIGQVEVLNADGWLKGMMNPEKIGLVGYSFGGYGALRTIGAKLNEETLTQYAAYADLLTEAEDFTGWSNAKLVPELNDQLILEHIKKVQRANLIAPSAVLALGVAYLGAGGGDSLVGDLGVTERLGNCADIGFLFHKSNSEIVFVFFQ